MKFHAAMLMLAGWYLMTPPLLANGRHDKSAPLGNWRIEAGSPSGQQCEQTQREQDIQRRLNQLTEEERSVMDRLLADKPNKAISAELHLSLRTVDRRRQSVLEKLGVGSVPELALMLGPLRSAEQAVRSRVAQ